jgi:hypothetical protein
MPTYGAGLEYPLEYEDAADGRSEGGNETDDEEKMEVGCGEETDMEHFAAHSAERGKEGDDKEGSHKSKELTKNTCGATVSEKAKRFIAENRVGGGGGCTPVGNIGGRHSVIAEPPPPPLKGMTLYGTGKPGPLGKWTAMDSAQLLRTFRHSSIQSGLPGLEHRIPQSWVTRMALRGRSAA